MVHSGQDVSVLQGIITHTTDSLETLISQQHFFGLGEETRVPKVKPQGQVKNMQAAHSHMAEAEFEPTNPTLPLCCRKMQISIKGVFFFWQKASQHRSLFERLQTLQGIIKQLLKINMNVRPYLVTACPGFWLNFGYYLSYILKMTFIRQHHEQVQK